MIQFTEVTVIKKCNIYFDGNVTSRTILFPDGTKKTLGIILPGKYEFKIGLKEIVEILSGELKVLIPGNPNWQEFKESGEFVVPADSTFKLDVAVVTDYCCSYIPE